MLWLMAGSTFGSEFPGSQGEKGNTLRGMICHVHKKKNNYYLGSSRRTPTSKT